MKNSDYNQQEIDFMIDELSIFHFEKLKDSEFTWLKERRGIALSQQDRDTLIGMYDRMAEPGY